MYCKKCGKEVDIGAQVCPYCGSPVQSEARPPVEKKGTGLGIGAIIGGLFIPLLGIILGIIAISQGSKTKNTTGIVLGGRRHRRQYSQLDIERGDFVGIDFLNVC